MITAMPLTYRLRKNVPLLLIIAAEFVALLVAARQAALPITPLSLAVALAMGAAGLLPALLKPTPVARMGGIFLIVLATLLLTPSAITMLQPSAMPAGAFLLEAPIYLSLRLTNGLFLFPIGLQLVHEFRRQANLPTLPHVVPLLCYACTAILLASLLLLPAGGMRIGAGFLILIYCFGLLILAARQTRRIIGRNDHTAQQTRLLIIALWLAQLPILARIPLFLLTGQSLPFDFVLVAQLILPIIYVYTVLRHDLYDIDTTVRRTLAALIITAVLVALSLLITLLLTRYLFLRNGTFDRLAILVLILAVAALFQPFYQRLQRRVDKLLFPEREQFQTQLGIVQSRLGAVSSRQAVATVLDDFATQVGATWHADRQQFALGTRPITFNADERRQLDALATLATVALAYADTLDRLNTLNSDLAQQVEQRTAQLLTQQRELAVIEERQRLARDLHDSVTQTLFSLSLSLRAIRKLTVKQPALAADELAIQEQTAQHALAEMRTLLTQLRTPLVADGDLATALREHVALLQKQGVPVVLRVHGAGRFSAETATQLLLLTREALHNAHKHSGASDIICTLSPDTLTITDNGCGFDPASPSLGMGLNSMQQRSADIGGKIEIVADENGTCIVVAY